MPYGKEIHIKIDINNTNKIESRSVAGNIILKSTYMTGAPADIVRTQWIEMDIPCNSKTVGKDNYKLFLQHVNSIFRNISFITKTFGFQMININSYQCVRFL